MAVLIYDLNSYDTDSRKINIIATQMIMKLLNKALSTSFRRIPLEYDLSELVPEEDMRDIMKCENLRQELLGYSNFYYQLNILITAILCVYLNTLVNFATVINL